MPDLVTVPAGYTIEYISSNCINDPVLGTVQTFVYNVTIPELIPQGCGLSSVAFELCDPDIHTVVEEGPFAPVNGLGGTVDVDSNPPLQPCMSDLDPAAAQQVKFNAGDVGPGVYAVTFTLLRCFELTDVTLAVHVGEACGVGGGGCQRLLDDAGEYTIVPLITGPSCDEVPPPPPRGIRMDELKNFL